MGRATSDFSRFRCDFDHLKDRDDATFMGGRAECAAQGRTHQEGRKSDKSQELWKNFRKEERSGRELSELEK